MGHPATDQANGATPAVGLRVLAADEDRAALAELAVVLRELGHEVTELAVTPSEAPRAVAEHDPEVAVVKVHGDEEHALSLIAEIAECSSGPVIALLDAEDPAFVAAAAEEGIFAYVRPVVAETVQAAIEVAVRRQAEAEHLEARVGQLQTALDRRTIIERAKGILMERHAIDDGAAFALLRDQARSANRTVVSVAEAVIDGHALLPSGTDD